MYPCGGKRKITSETCNFMHDNEDELHYGGKRVRVYQGVNEAEPNNQTGRVEAPTDRALGVQ